jgi:hypothetical protein
VNSALKAIVPTLNEIRCARADIAELTPEGGNGAVVEPEIAKVPTEHSNLSIDYRRCMNGHIIEKVVGKMNAQMIRNKTEMMSTAKPLL